VFLSVGPNGNFPVQFPKTKAKKNKYTRSSPKLFLEDRKNFVKKSTLDSETSFSSAVQLKKKAKKIYQIVPKTISAGLWTFQVELLQNFILKSASDSEMSCSSSEVLGVAPLKSSERQKAAYSEVWLCITKQCRCVV